MYSQEIPAELELYAIKLHREGVGRYVPVTSDDGVSIFFFNKRPKDLVGCSK